MEAHVYYVVMSSIRWVCFMIISKEQSKHREMMCGSITFTLRVICCIILPNIKLIFWKDMGDIEEEKGEWDSDTAHTFTPEANRIIFEAPNGWFSSLSISPPGAPHQWLPALKGKAIIDLGHRQREGQNCSAPHNQPQSPKKKRQRRDEQSSEGTAKKARTDEERERSVVERKGQILGEIQFLQEKKKHIKEERQMDTDRWREWEFKIKSPEKEWIGIKRQESKESHSETNILWKNPKTGRDCRAWPPKSRWDSYGEGGDAH